MAVTSGNLPPATRSSNSTRSNTGSYYSIGSGAMALASGFASLQAASMQARQYKIEGIFLDLQANQEKLRARENAIFLRQKFLKNIASSKASLAGRGVSGGSGIGRQMVIQDLKTLGQDLQANELNTQAAINSLDLRGSQSKLNQRTARNMGLLQAAGPISRGTESLLTGFSTLNTGAK
jgi:hypothetical protein